jgi:hypothetical protein
MQILDMSQATIDNPVTQTRALCARPSYGFANTANILASFREAGWSPVEQLAIRPRRPERQGFQRHLVRLQHPEYVRIPGLTQANGTRPEMVIMNSHDSSTSLRMNWGLLRIVCLNGIIAGNQMQQIKIIHSKRPLERELPLAIEAMLKSFPLFVEQIQRLQNRRFTASALAQLTKTVYDARLSTIKRLREVDYAPPVLLRDGDKSEDAFTLFNRLQEAMMRGGIRYRYERLLPDGSFAMRERTSGKVNSLDLRFHLNRIAYDAALELAS